MGGGGGLIIGVLQYYMHVVDVTEPAQGPY